MRAWAEMGVTARRPHNCIKFAPKVHFELPMLPCLRPRDPGAELGQLLALEFGSTLMRFVIFFGLALVIPVGAMHVTSPLFKPFIEVWADTSLVS